MIDKKLLRDANNLEFIGTFLDCIISMYKSVKFRVKVNGCLGPEFDSKVGTKQGDPLSPTLFGLYIEQLHDLLQLEAPGIGPILNGIHIPDLLYADDTT